jgi:hypothetical protein
MSDLDENVCNAIVDGLLAKFGSVTPREFIIRNPALLKKFDQAFSSVPLIDVERVKFLKVPSNFAMGNNDGETIEKLKKDYGITDGLIEQIKISTNVKRAYHERLLVENINQAKLETPRDDDKIKQLIQYYTPPFFSSVYVPEDAVPPRIAWDAGRNKSGYAIGTMLPPVSTDILLVGSYIESCMIILVEGLTCSNLSRIHYAYKISDQFTILLFIMIEEHQ